MSDEYREWTCRLCAKHACCTDIFSDSGMKQSLSYKITTCLPFQIAKDDDLTKFICYTCIQKLNVAFELISTAVLVQSKLMEAANNKNQQNPFNQPEVSSSAIKSSPPVSKESPISLLNMLPSADQKLVKSNDVQTGNHLNDTPTEYLFTLPEEEGDGESRIRCRELHDARLELTFSEKV